MIKSFGYYSATHLKFGEGCRQFVSESISAVEGHKICVVSDAFLLATSFGRQLLEWLPTAKIFSSVVPNPTIESADECAAFSKQGGCDCFVALGGGSAIDTAKAAAVVQGCGGSAMDYLDGIGQSRKAVTAACLPVIAIPTTAGTGSEISQYAVLTNAKTQRKDSISSEFLYPRWALVDPEVTFGLPAGLTVSTGLDVLSHAIESITSTIENPLTDLLAAEAISLVFAWLPRCNSTDDHEARNHMSYASSLAGLAMSHCCGTLPHAMGCPLSGHCGVPHGLAVGVLQKATLQLISAKSNDKLTFIAEYLDPNWRSSTATAADYICARIDTLFASLGRDPRLSEFHISNEQIEQMIPDALAHGCASLTPVKTDAEMIRKIYQSIV